MPLFEYDRLNPELPPLPAANEFGLPFNGAVAATLADNPNCPSLQRAIELTVESLDPAATLELAIDIDEALIEDSDGKYVFLLSGETPTEVAVDEAGLVRGVLTTITTIKDTILDYTRMRLARDADDDLLLNYLEEGFVNELEDIIVAREGSHYFIQYMEQLRGALVSRQLPDDDSAMVLPLFID